MGASSYDQSGPRDSEKCTNCLEIPITDSIFENLKQKELLLQGIVSSKFDCSVFLTNREDSDAQPSLSPSAVLYKTSLPEGLQVSVWKDDLTRHKADAVVNAANEDLKHWGGLALALATAGGATIEYQSEQWIKAKGKVKTGEIAVTDAGKLPCKKVIHAVGPRWSSYMASEEQRRTPMLLKKAIENVLSYANQQRNSIRSVAIPAVSSGIFGFPVNLCADVIVNTIKTFPFTNWNKHGFLKEIHLVNNDDPTVLAMKASCIKLLGDTAAVQPKTYSAAAAASMTPTPASLTPMSNRLQINNLSLRIESGSIENQKTAAIVNTIDDSLKLNIGAISRAILATAGSSLQEEVKEKGKSHKITYGDVIHTRGHRLGCKHVYHAVCCWYQEKNSCKILRKIVKTVLKFTKDYGLNSVAFPAIGTGALSFPKDLVANILVEGVIEFGKEFPAKNLEVLFVIHPDDREALKAFERELASARGKQKAERKPAVSMADEASFSESPPMTDVKKKVEKSPAEVRAVIELSGGTPEALEEARSWIESRVLLEQEQLAINNNHMCYFGQKEHRFLSKLKDQHSVFIIETVTERGAGLEISGSPRGVLAAALEIEELICRVQEEHARKEEEELLQPLVQWGYFDLSPTFKPYSSAANRDLEEAYFGKKTLVSVNDAKQVVSLDTMKATAENGKEFRIERTFPLDIDYLAGLPKDYKRPSKGFYLKTSVSPKETEYRERETQFGKAGLQIVKVERILNFVLLTAFNIKKDFVRKHVLNSQKVTRRLFHRVPATFCNLVCRSGFQRIYSQPDKQNLGNGIYFSSSLESVMKDQDMKFQSSELIYVFEAEVLTGHPTRGKESYVAPPAVGSDQLRLYDSLVDQEKNSKTFVIFSNSQAYPTFLITCKREKGSPV
nr:PREDICTED: poly [ADP-ribose] polymerase 9-like [Latimeria chalumnae]|eukprot:XP_006004374.1 PREDICTED: poly [ADP-ribose] polymerase 9-like [Latimeria chalumnae]